MGDLIDRQAAIDEIRRCRFVVDAIEKINGLPSAQPERKKGKWIHERLASTTGGSYPIVRCSVCQGTIPMEWETHYCPHCGADMREAQ